MKRAWLYGALALGGICCGPDLSCDPDEDYVPSCNYGENGSLAAGHWRLEGHGYRSDCSDRRLEGRLTIRSSRVVQVEAMPEMTSSAPGADGGMLTESDAFLERIERADYNLSAGALPEDATFEGDTSGSCVYFSFSEELDDGSEVTYSFNGAFDGSHRIRGSFIGDGPEDCHASGFFSVDIY